ncbi:MAG: UbiA family prenyltransferase [Minicystis sp.]
MLEILAAVRFRKLLPGLLVLFNAAMLTGERMSLAGALLAAAFVVACGAAGMKLNVITDRELDAGAKPELYATLPRDRTRLARSIAIELAASAASLAALMLIGRPAAAALALAFGAMFTLYSYNFLVPPRAQRWRLKVFWWGNGLTVCGAYLALWLVGMSVTALSLSAVLRRDVLMLVGACVVFEYSLFLNECGTDADAERAAGLRTIPALVGRRGTSFVAIALWVIACVVVAIARRGSPVAVFTTRLSIMALWYAAVTGIAGALFLVLAFAPHAPSRRDRIVDAAFWVLRAVPSTVLVSCSFGGGATAR